MDENQLCNKTGLCYWVTGLSASGKTTVSSGFAKAIRDLGYDIVVLDGDVMREILGVSAYTRAERIQLGYRYSRIAKLLTEQGVDVIVAVIGLFSEIHEWNRENIDRYVEVFLDVPSDELLRRDPKGLYKRYEKGCVENVAGFDLEVDFPSAPDHHLKWEKGVLPEYFVNRLVRDYKEQKRDL